MPGLHASLTPNHVLVGEILEIEFDSEEAFKSAKGVTVKVVEINVPSEFETSKGKSTTLFTARGELIEHNFSFTSNGGANPVIPKATANVPIIKIKLGDQIFDVPLMDPRREQGVFELQLQVTTKSPEGSFISSIPVFVRAFDHFKAQGTERPVVALITGAPDGSFFTAATKFWQQNADVVLARDGISIQEILDILDKEGEKYGPWGQINIVAHGHLHDLLLRIAPDLPRFIHADQIQIDLDFLSKKGISLPIISAIDNDTQIVIRACNAGNDQTLIDEIHSKLFHGQGTLFIPKFIQEYKFQGDIVTESFAESLFFAVPGPASPTGAALQAGLEKAWDELRSPGKGGITKEEISTFKENGDFDKLFQHFLPIRIPELCKSDGTPMTDTEIIAQLRKDWISEHKLHEKSKTWFTDDQTWRIRLVAKKATSPPSPEWLFRVTKGISTPPAAQFVQGGGLSFGSDAGVSMWVIQAPNLQGVHAFVHMGPADNEVTVEDIGSGTPTFVGKEQLPPGGQKTFKLPVTIQMGQAEVVVSEGQVVMLEFECRRRHIDRRRELRTFDTSKPHDQRERVTPVVGNPEHYGSSR